MEKRDALSKTLMGVRKRLDIQCCLLSIFSYATNKVSPLLQATAAVRLAKAALVLGHPKFEGLSFHVCVHQDACLLMGALIQQVEMHKSFAWNIS